MYVKRRYGFIMTFRWSIRPFILGLVFALVVFSISYFFELNLALPWQPLSVIGIAVAFYLGFKNNSSYDRIWEARKIWGGIVNNSRSFGAAACSFIKGPEAPAIRKELIYRHVAWLTALRYQLRLQKEWEHKENRLNGLFAPTVCEDYMDKLDRELEPFLSKQDIDALENKSNLAVHILKIQTVRLQELRDQDYYEDFRHMEFFHLVHNFYVDQGKAERIKNFPFPRQYASTALWLSIVFVALVPFGMLNAFEDMTPALFWVGPFLSALVTWVFFLMEKIGDYSENPFEGTYNDVPITAISRGIEIDLRQMIDDDNIPAPTADVNGFLL